MVTGAFSSESPFRRNTALYNQLTSPNRSCSRFFYPDLIRRFVSRRVVLAIPRLCLVGAYAREGIRVEPAGPLLPVSRRSDRHLACNRCDHASSAEIYL